MKNILELIRDHLGSDFRAMNIHVIADAPVSELKRFLLKAEEMYWSWLDEGIRARKTFKGELFHPLLDEPAQYTAPVDWAKRIRQRLLYLHAFTIEDPLATVIHAPSIAAALGIGTDLSKLRVDVRFALEKLVALAPLTDRSEVMLVPLPMVGLSPKLQEKAREALREFGSLGNDPLRDEVVLWTQFCDLFDLHPLATREGLDKYIRYGQEIRDLGPTADFAANAVVKYEIPRAEKLSFEQVLELRDNEAAFAEFRATFGSVLADANRNTATEPTRFAAEFKSVANERLGQALSRVNHATQVSPFLTDVFIPGGLSLTTIALGFAITGSSPTAALVGAGLLPVSWMMKNAVRRHNESGQKNSVLKSFYSSLIEER